MGQLTYRPHQLLGMFARGKPNNRFKSQLSPYELSISAVRTSRTLESLSFEHHRS